MNFWAWLIKTLSERHWGDVLNVIGVVLSLVGFTVTIWQVIRARKAAMMAEEAALKVRNAIQSFDTVEKFSAAITIMEEMKRLHRIAAWELLPDRYSTLRGLLISIRGASPGLSQEHQAVLLGAIQHSSAIERKIERAIMQKSKPPDAARLNEIVSIQIDKLHEVLASLRQNVGVEYYGGQKASELNKEVKGKNS